MVSGKVSSMQQELLNGADSACPVITSIFTHLPFPHVKLQANLTPCSLPLCTKTPPHLLPSLTAMSTTSALPSCPFPRHLFPVLQPSPLLPPLPLRLLPHPPILHAVRTRRRLVGRHFAVGKACEFAEDVVPGGFRAGDRVEAGGRGVVRGGGRVAHCSELIRLLLLIVLEGD